MTNVLVDVVEILRGQCLRYFSFDSFCHLYDNINEEVFNGSFVVLLRKKYDFKVTR